MYPESYPSYDYQTPAPNNRRKLFIIAGLVAALIVVAIITLLNKAPSSNTATDTNSPEYVITKTGLNAGQNFAYIDGANIYAYNGMDFYKTGFGSDNQISVLSSGLKLPKPSAIYWAGSKGALMSFSQSFTSTKVEDIVKAGNQQMDNSTRSFVWYLDFATGNLKLASSLAIKSNLAVYSPTDNGFYYVAANSPISPSSKTPMYFYNITTGKSDLIQSDLGLSNISSLSLCPSAPKVCYVGQSGTSQQLYGIDKNNKQTILYKSSGLLFPTNNPSVFSVASQDQSTSTTNASPLSFYNITTQQASSLGLSSAMGSDVMASFNSANDFFMLTTYSTSTQGTADSQQQATTEDTITNYAAGSIDDHGKVSIGKPVLIHYKGGAAYKGSIIDVAGNGNAGASLLTASDYSQLLFSKAEQPVSVPAIATQQAAQATVQNCIASGAKTSQYFADTQTFRIVVVSDNNFENNIRNFSACMLQNGRSALYGYNYQFAGSDPVNERLTTD